ncbi:hypothetical protein BDZ89DRAFT_804821 [Hymenopellis radicata]|nr:hypothetical protein BDZ89DRAFT_804821 [Hymenopellis radicata]
MLAVMFTFQTTGPLRLVLTPSLHQGLCTAMVSCYHATCSRSYEKYGVRLGTRPPSLYSGVYAT